MKLLKAWIWHWINFALAHTPLRLRSLMRIVPAIVPTDYPGVSIVVHSPIDFYVRRISAKREPETVKWIEEMKPGDVLYDVGANVGTYSLIAAKRHKGKIRIYAFEPGYANYAALCDNLKINSAEVAAFPVALGDSTGMDTFFYRDVMPGASCHALGEPVDYNHRPFSPVFSHTVLAWKLDDFIEHYRLPWPTHLKLDVDGTEFQILKGARSALRNIRQLIVELSEKDSQFGDVMDYLGGCGFALTSRPESYLGSRTPHPHVYNFHFSNVNKLD